MVLRGSGCFSLQNVVILTWAARGLQVVIFCPILFKKEKIQSRFSSLFQLLRLLLLLREAFSWFSAGARGWTWGSRPPEFRINWCSIYLSHSSSHSLQFSWSLHVLILCKISIKARERKTSLWEALMMFKITIMFHKFMFLSSDLVYPIVALLVCFFSFVYLLFFNFFNFLFSAGGSGLSLIVCCCCYWWVWTQVFKWDSCPLNPRSAILIGWAVVHQLLLHNS